MDQQRLLSTWTRLLGLSLIATACTVTYVAMVVSGWAAAGCPGLQELKALTRVELLVYCLDSLRVEANEAFGNVSHTIPGSSFNGRPQAAQQAFKGIKYLTLIQGQNTEVRAQSPGSGPMQLRSTSTKLQNPRLWRYFKCCEYHLKGK